MAKQKSENPTYDALLGQVAKDEIMFARLSINVRKARREELERVWPKEFLPDADQAEFELRDAAEKRTLSGIEG